MSLLHSPFGSPGFSWNERSARHLLNRAGFGVPPGAVRKLAAMKPHEAVAAFVDYERFPDPLPPPDWLPQVVELRDMRRMMESLSEQDRRRLRQDRQREERESMSRLQIWWLNRMCRSQRPLEEKLALFWHGHFATSAEKVREPRYNHELIEVFRKHGAGNFRTLVTLVGQSPAMLRYLDQAQSNRKQPNENWARELMELFTLGIGNYTERDIKESARAFTGWTERKGQFAFDRRRHDNGVKTFLGRSGHFNGDQIISIILEQPACAEFICRKLWKFFAYEDPEPEVVEGLAETLRQGKYEIRPVLRQIFSSRAFYSDKAVASQIKSPAQLVVNLLVQLDAPLEERPPVGQLAMRAMGQTLYSPPNVKGWDGGRAWINTNTLLVRYNFASFLVSGVVPDFGPNRGGGFGNLTRQLRDAMERKNRGMDGREPLPQPLERRGEEMGDASGGELMMGGGGMVEEGAMVPAGQDAMPADNPSRTLYGALRQRRQAPPDVKEQKEMTFASFRARDLFAPFEGMTAVEMVDELVAYFIGFPLEENQRQKLVGVLAGKNRTDRPLSMTQLSEADMRAAVQLLLSTAEYQVC